MCGVRTTLLQAARGWLLFNGSGVITSSPAPPSFPACNQHCSHDDIDDGVDDGSIHDDLNDGYLKGLNQSLLVNEPTPGSVYDTGGRVHLRQQASRYDALRRRI